MKEKERIWRFLKFGICEVIPILDEIVPNISMLVLFVGWMSVSSECSVCYSPYDEATHCPRLLTCGHTFCHECVSEVLVNGKVICPIDRATMKVERAEMLPKNHSLLNLDTSLHDDDAEREDMREDDMV